MAAGRLISKLADAVSELPDTIKAGDAFNFFKGLGVKDAELEGSDLGPFLRNVNPEDQVSRQQIEEGLSMRTDNTDVSSNKKYLGFSLPDTDALTYQSRVYRNPRRATGTDSHFHDEPDYIFHTRSDIVPTGQLEADHVTETMSPDNILDAMINNLSDTLDLEKPIPVDDAMEAAQMLVNELPTAGDDFLAAIRVQLEGRETVNLGELNIPELSYLKQATSIEHAPSHARSIMNATAMTRNLRNVADSDNVVNLDEIERFVGDMVPPPELREKLNNALPEYKEQVAEAVRQQNPNAIIETDDGFQAIDFSELPEDFKIPDLQRFARDKGIIPPDDRVLRVQEIQSDTMNNQARAERNLGAVRGIVPQTGKDLKDSFTEGYGESELDMPTFKSVLNHFLENLPESIRTADFSRMLDNQLEPYIVRNHYEDGGSGQDAIDLRALPDDFELDFNSLADVPKLSPEQEINVFREGISQELVRASEEGIPRVAIAINPEGTFNLHRDASVQRRYETQVKSTARKLANKIGGTFEEKKGYVLIGLPAGGFTLDTYADEDKTKSFIESAVARGATEQQARDMLFVRRAQEEFGLSEEEARAALEQRKQGQQGGDLPVDEIGQQQPAVDTTQIGQGAPPPTPATAEMRPATPGERLRSAQDDQQGLGKTLLDTVTSSVSSVAQRFIGDRARETEAMGDIAAENPRQEGESRTDAFLRQNEAIEEASIQEPKTVEQFVADLEQTQRIARPILQMSAPFNAEAEAAYNAIRTDMSSTVVSMAEEHGVPLEFRDGAYYTKDQQGNEVEVTPGVLQELHGDKFEIGSAMAGGAVGWRLTPGNFVSKTVGSLGGAALGSVVGSQADYVAAAIETQTTLEAKMAMDKAMGAALASVTYDVAFGVGLGLGGLALKGSAASYRLLNHAYNLSTNGNRPAAVDALLQETHLTRGDAEELVRLWENVHRTDAPGTNMEEKMLAIIPTVSSGGENILAGIRQGNRTAIANVTDDINTRANDLLRAARESADPQAAARVMTQFRQTVDDANILYREVRGQFTKGSIPEDRVLNFENRTNLAINSVMDNIPMDKAEQGTLLAEKANRLLDNSRNIQTPEDLIEFRQSITAIKNSRAVTNTVALERLDDVLRAVDAEIDIVAKHNMGHDGARDWGLAWKNARKQYSKVRQLEGNVMWNALTNEGFTPDTIAQHFVQYGPTIDDTFRRGGGQPVNTFRQVMDELPTQSVAEVENIITRELIEKFTMGREGQLRATQFPELSRQLSMYDLRTPKARQLKAVVDEFAKIHQVDTALLMGAGGISFQAFRSYLTTDPIVRAQFALASKVFNYASQLAPGEEAKSRALVNLTGRFLSEPLNTRTVNDFMNEFEGDQEFVTAVRGLQALIARNKAEGQEYKGGLAKLWKDSSGRLFMGEGQGRTQAESIPLQRIAREDYVRQHFGYTGNDLRDMPRVRKAKLISDGFQAIALEDGRVIKLL